MKNDDYINLVDYQKSLYEEKLKLGIEVLNLPTRVYNALTRYMDEPVTTIGELLEKSYDDLKKTINIGTKGLSDIIKSVHDFGLKFNFEMEEELPSTIEDYVHLYERYHTLIKKKEQILLEKELELSRLGYKLNSIEDKIIELSKEDEKTLSYKENE